MRILEVQAREIVAIFEENVEGLSKIKMALDIAELKSNNTEEKEAAKYLTLVVYPIIVEMLEKIKGQNNG